MDQQCKLKEAGASWPFLLYFAMINYMKFEIITIFPDIFDSYFQESIIGRAQKKQLLEIVVHNLRDYSEERHRKVDDTPYGGGAGMVLQVEPVWNCFDQLSQKARLANRTDKKEKTRTILFSAKGKQFTQRVARRLSEYDRISMLCGRYEGVDERVAENIVDEEISIGRYVLTGGEIAAMVVVDSISRLIPGVLGNESSIREESFSRSGYLEYPQYTKPREFHGWKVPDVLFSGDHEKIGKWRDSNSKKLKRN
jgi:tRNA (guanine37-N1)-methyltransferase